MPWPYKRNAAQEFDFPLFDADGDLVNESGTITTQVAIDGQTFVNVSGAVNQYGTTGVYKFSGQAPDWNGARVTFKVTSPIVKPTVLTFHTDNKGFVDIPTLGDLKAQAENAMTAFSALKSSVSGRLLDVSAGGEAGLDWANVGTPTSTVNLSNTTLSGVNTIQKTPPTVQDIWSYVSRDTGLTGVAISGVWGHPVRTITGGGGSAEDVWTYATRAITDKDSFNLAADQSGVTVGAVSGAVGSVTGNVGGNVTGSVGSVAQSGISPSSMGADVREQIASDVFKRGIVRDETNLEDRSLGWAISKLVNKVEFNAGQTTMTIRRSNDSTALFTQNLTTSGGAQPVTAVDTA